MITIHHVLKDGREVDSIEGHVIKADEFSMLYEVVSRINNRKEEHHEAVRTPRKRS